MKLKVSSNKGQFVLKGLSMVTDFLQLNHDSSVAIFCNLRKQSQHFSVHLDKKLDQAKLSIDVIIINGSLDKVDNFGGFVFSVTITTVARGNSGHL